MLPQKSSSERRIWARLPLHVPLFVRTRNRDGKDFLEFATALNISAGGALVALHASVRPRAQVLVEIPMAPLPRAIPVRKSSRHLRARIARVIHADGYNLVALRFLQPLQSSEKHPKARRRKPASAM
ncbi:MAG TPA: PilZ domain-containing protein [Terriglobales bacterium]|nr:PilZ domain-containing protein [Terriglobales bacterium]